MAPEETRFLQLCAEQNSGKLMVLVRWLESEGICSLLPSFQDMFAVF